METLYRWRVQEKNRRGELRWRLVRMPMTEETARFWAANNNKVIQRVEMPVTPGMVPAAVAAAARAASKAN